MREVLFSVISALPPSKLWFDVYSKMLTLDMSTLARKGESLSLAMKTKVKEMAEVFADEAQQFIGHGDFFVRVEEKRWYGGTPGRLFAQGVIGDLRVDLMFSAMVAGQEKKLVVQYINTPIDIVDTVNGP
jgi:hypothetical protein